MTAIKIVLSDAADAVFVVGFEVQNTVKAVYGADYLAGAGYINGERKDGHAYFFPNLFSERAGTYSDKLGPELARKGMARWFQVAIENARKNPKGQEYHNKVENLFELGMTPCNPEIFLEHLNLYDCSKVSDGASAVVILSEGGLKRTGTRLEDCVEIAGFAQCQEDIARKPEDPSFLRTTGQAVNQAMEAAGAKKDEIAVLELHDCFSITGLIALESIGFVERGKAPKFLLDGNTAVEGSLPVNPSGGLCGLGHPTGATGVRQMVDLLHQFTGKAENQVNIGKPYGLMANMGSSEKPLFQSS
jgi:acetyl-CoA C-acetyltransferase/acetyl-CoA acyltransferase